MSESVRTLEVHFSHHILIFLHKKELSYSNITSQRLLQKQSSFDKIDLCASEIAIQYSLEKHNSCYPAYLANIKSKPSGILNIRVLGFDTNVGVTNTGCLSHLEINDYSFKLIG